jgi:AraC family ethanolamine operon transcriptional activator
MKPEMNPGQTGKRWDLIIDQRYDEFDEFTESIYGWDLDFRPLQAGSPRTGVLQFGSPDLLVSRMDLSLRHEQRGSTPPELLTLGLIGTGLGSAATSDGALDEDALWCFSAGGEFGAVSPSEFSCCTLSLSLALVDEVADCCELSEARAALGSAQIITSRQPGVVDAIRQRLLTLAAEIGSGGIAGLEPEQVHELEFSLVQQILEALAVPQTVVSPMMTHRRRLVLGRALDWLDANPGLPVTVRRLAQVCGAGVRTLEYAFQDYFGVSPKAYLTLRRLMGVHRELKRANAGSTRVGVVANNWGFWHLGQFAQDYQRFFGELPSHTLGKNMGLAGK